MAIAIAEQLGVDSGALGRLCKNFGVRWLAVFGSVARGEARPDSDVDVLYELLPERSMGYIALETFAESLGELLGGRRVDLGRPSQLHWYYRDKVLGEAKVLYEE